MKELGGNEGVRFECQVQCTHEVKEIAILSGKARDIFGKFLPAAALVGRAAGAIETAMIGACWTGVMNVITRPIRPITPC